MSTPDTPRPDAAPAGTPPADRQPPDADLHRDDVAPADEKPLDSLGRAVGEAVLGSPHPPNAPSRPHDTPPRTTRLADLPPVRRSGRHR